MSETRRAVVERQTAETEIRIEVNLDGRGQARVRSGIGFLDHMLATLARHAFFDLDVEAQGDLQVDPHHTVEDVAICLGQAIAKALGRREGIARFGWAVIPMDDALVMAAVDLSGRPYSDVDLPLLSPQVGALDTQLVAEFFRSLSWAGALNLHVRRLAGQNDHHLVEAAFKAVARALAAAVSGDPRTAGKPPSTKGVLGEEDHGADGQSQRRAAGGGSTGGG